MRKLLFVVIVVSLFLNQAPAEQTTYSGIEIIGDTRFIKQVKASLVLIQDGAPEAFAVIKRYVGRIEQGEKSGMLVNKEPPSYELNSRTAFYSITWCAGSIAHDSYHSKLYHEYKMAHGGTVPEDVWKGIEVEEKCIEYQIEVMQQIGAPKHEIDYLKSLDGSYCDFDRDGDFDWDDYIRRNW